MLVKIAAGWGIAPVAAGIISFVLLFFVQNVFEQQVVKLTGYSLTDDVLAEVRRQGVDPTPLTDLVDSQVNGSSQFRKTLEQRKPWSERELVVIFSAAEIDSMRVDSLRASQKIDSTLISAGQWRALAALHGRSFVHRWEIDRALEDATAEWQPPAHAGNEVAAKRLRSLRELVYETSRTNK